MSRLKSRQMRREELEALEQLIAYSDMYHEKEHWLEMGAPPSHAYLILKTLLDYLQECKPDTPLGDPVIVDNKGKPISPFSPYDQQDDI